jgi:hypothetical protein
MTEEGRIVASLVDVEPSAPAHERQPGTLPCHIFKSFDDIVDHCYDAWNTLINQPWKIMSIARRDWASVGYSM